MELCTNLSRPILSCIMFPVFRCYPDQALVCFIRIGSRINKWLRATGLVFIMRHDKGLLILKRVSVWETGVGRARFNLIGIQRVDYSSPFDTPTMYMKWW